ncbi:MAG: hypothetical protein Q9159_003360, partial [Coniocarpon cinnabarinum]
MQRDHFYRYQIDPQPPHHQQPSQDPTTAGPTRRTRRGTLTHRRDGRIGPRLPDDQYDWTTFRAEGYHNTEEGRLFFGPVESNPDVPGQMIQERSNEQGRLIGRRFMTIRMGPPRGWEERVEFQEPQADFNEGWLPLPDVAQQRLRRFGHHDQRLRWMPIGYSAMSPEQRIALPAVGPFLQHPPPAPAQLPSINQVLAGPPASTSARQPRAPPAPAQPTRVQDAGDANRSVTPRAPTGPRAMRAQAASGRGEREEVLPAGSYWSS